ncbi:hypothetical protein MMC07_003338 [Pseudocyphellaria aurata]|nr:hypothetical protein [Pseudocyphellaria aurata]
MLDGLFMLLTLSTVMAIASFLAGSLPLSFPLSQSRLRLISTIGMGVLVGTSLIVIIPEGVETLYSASDPSKHTQTRRNISPATLPNREHLGISQFSKRSFFSKSEDVPGPVIPSLAMSDTTNPPPATPTSANVIHILDDDSSSFNSTPPSERTPHVWIGLSLILGFILMYLLDTLPTLSAPSHSRPPTTNIYSLSDLSSNIPPPPPSRTLSTTLGLCIHAAADGIALGASSSSTTTTSLSLIIFVAIMVHKAPAAFGLTSVLLKQGLGKRGARAHLVVFSLAAPVGAVGTWVVVRTLGGGGGEEETMRWWTGVLLLFSGGTFLYVAMHTMQESENPNSPSNTSLEPEHGGGGGNGYLDGSSHHHHHDGRALHRPPREGRSLKFVLVAVAGMLLPLVTQIGHAH